MPAARAIHPVLGIFLSDANTRVGGHAFAAIFYPDADGHVSSYFPVDYWGPYLRQHQTQQINCGLFLPITRQSANALRAFADQLHEKTLRETEPLLDEQKTPVSSSQPRMQYPALPYYLWREAADRQRFERKGKPPMQFDGTAEELCSTSKFEGDPESLPRVGTDCFDFIIQVSRLFAGIPLERIGVDLSDTFSHRSIERLCEKYLKHTSGFSGVTDIGEGTKILAIQDPFHPITIPDDFKENEKFNLREVSRSKPLFDPKLCKEFTELQPEPEKNLRR